MPNDSAAARECPRCLLCGAKSVVRHFYPPTRFKRKLFHYYRCSVCATLSIFPVPGNDELNEIYGICNHPYLLDPSTGDGEPLCRAYRRYTQEDYQLRFLREDLAFFPGPRLLDYGCGSGFYLAAAQDLGLNGVGVEYGTRLARTLRKKTGLAIESVAEFSDLRNTPSFDVIHLGHILEHVADPSRLVQDLRQHAHAETVFVVDGPLEANACLSRWVIDLGSRLKRHPHSDVAPQHLTMTTRASQLAFFERNRLAALRYVVAEQYWPLPGEPPRGSLSGLGRHGLARASILLSDLVKPFGNVFHYVGRVVPGRSPMRLTVSPASGDGDARE